MLKKLNLTVINTVYICMMIVYMTIREILPLNFLIDSVIVSAAIFAVGFVLIILDLITRKKCIEGIMQDILIAFLGVCCISSLINFSYGGTGGLFANIKFIAAIGIEYLIFFCFSRNTSKEKISKLLNPISITLIITWAVPVIFSVLTYFCGIDILISGRGTWGSTNQGFSNEYMRLWGIFQDPNYASVTSIISIFASLRLIFTSKKTVPHILCTINIALQLAYIILGGSRAALLLLLGSSVIFFAYKYLFSGEKNIRKIAVSFGKCVLCIAVSFILIFGTKYTLPYAKAIFFSKNEAVNSLIGEAYEKLYSFSGYEFEMLSEKTDTPPDDTTEPSTEESTNDEGTTDEPVTNEESTSEEESTTDTPSPEKPPVITPIDRTDLSGMEDVSNGRITRWKQTIKIFLEAPFFGTSPRGLTVFARNHESTKDTIISKFGIAPHNGYLDVLAETGIIGFSVLGAAIILALFVIFKSFFKEKFSEDRGFLLIGILSLFGIAVFISDVFMIFSINSLLFWVLLGFAYNQAGTHTDKGIIYTVYEKTIGRLISKISSGK